MGLAIDGNVVNGIARGGQAFLNLGDVNKNGSLNIGGQNYLSEKKIRLDGTANYDLGFSNSVTSTEMDVTGFNLSGSRHFSDDEGYLATCIIAYDNDELTNTLSSPFIIPTAPKTNDLFFDTYGWSGSLAKTTDNKFQFTVSYSGSDTITTASVSFYMLSNKN